MAWGGGRYSVVPPLLLPEPMPLVRRPQTRAAAQAPVPSIDDDATLLTLVAWDEARGEPEEGQAAVVRTVLNRIARGRSYQTDGTMKGTVFKSAQFEGFWYDAGDKERSRTMSEARAAEKLKTAVQSPEWAKLRKVVQQVVDGTYEGPSYDSLGDATLFLNPNVASPQGWDTPEHHVATIGRHKFYRE